MNMRLIVFAAIVTAVIGAGLGVATARLTNNRFVSPSYQHLDVKFAIIGAGLGLVVGSSQESIRQLKKQRDLEDHSV
jgi:hypothetical protein